MGKKILIIDDEEGFAQMVKLNLEELGSYQVQIETQGAKGLTAAKTFHPHLIFLDIIIPDMEGPEIFAQIRRDESLKDIPIIFLTATVRKEEVDSQNGMIAGHPFIAKPGTIKDLLDSIQRNLN